MTHTKSGRSSSVSLFRQLHQVRDRKMTVGTRKGGKPVLHKHCQHNHSEGTECFKMSNDLRSTAFTKTKGELHLRKKFVIVGAQWVKPVPAMPPSHRVPVQAQLLHFRFSLLLMLRGNTAADAARMLGALPPQATPEPSSRLLASAHPRWPLWPAEE